MEIPFYKLYLAKKLMSNMQIKKAIILCYHVDDTCARKSGNNFNPNFRGLFMGMF